MAKTGTAARKMTVKRARSAPAKTAPQTPPSPLSLMLRALGVSFVALVIGGLCVAYAMYEAWKLEEMLSRADWGKHKGGMGVVILSDPSHTWIGILLAFMAGLLCTWIMWSNLRAAWRALEQI